MCVHGSYLAKTVAELTEEQAELLEAARKGLNAMESEFAGLIQAAKDAGVVESEKDVAQLARYVQVQITGCVYTPKPTKKVRHWSR